MIKNLFSFDGACTLWPLCICALGAVCLFDQTQSHRCLCCTLSFLLIALGAAVCYKWHVPSDSVLSPVMQNTTLQIAAGTIAAASLIICTIASYYSQMKKRMSSHKLSSMVKCFVVMGGSDLKVSSQAFEGGWIVAWFGGVQLDLRGAELNSSSTQEKEGQQLATLSVAAVFGGVEINVPPDWEVVCQGCCIMGGINNKAARQQKEQQQGQEGHNDGSRSSHPRCLVIKGVAVLGSIGVLR